MTSSSKSKPISISLPPVLLSEVSRRIQGGLYSSTSEVIREALRFYFSAQSSEPTNELLEGGARLKSALDMGDLGVRLRNSKILPQHSKESASARVKLAALQQATEEDNGLKISQTRLKKLKVPH